MPRISSRPLGLVNISPVPGLLAAGLLAACGGGGGGGGLTPADATVVIDANNAIDIVRNVEASSSFVEGITMGLVVNAAVSSSAAATSGAADSVDYADLSATALSPEFCDGGLADINESGLVVTFTFVDCVNFTFGDGDFGSIQLPGTLDGVLRIEVSAASVDETDFRATVILTNFSIDDGMNTTWSDGSLTLDYLETATDIVVEVTTGSLDLEENSDTRSLSGYRYFLIADAIQLSEDSDGGLNSSDFDLLAYFETPVPYVTDAGDPWPSVGRRIIYGADLDRIQLTPQSDGLNALLELDLDGVDGFETSCTYGWDILLGSDPLVACAGG